MRPSLKDEVAEFARSVMEEKREFGLDDHQLWAIDETGIESGGVPRKTFVDPLTKDRSVLETCPRRRDTLILAVSKGGDKVAKVIEHTNARKNRETGEDIRAVRGMQLPHMHAFVDQFANEQGVRGSLMVQDNLSAHVNAETKRRWGSKQVKPRNLPPQGGRLDNPLDKYIFGITKEAIKAKDTSTFKKKETAILDVVEAIPESTIRKCFIRRGF